MIFSNYLSLLEIQLVFIIIHYYIFLFLEYLFSFILTSICINYLKALIFRYDFLVHFRKTFPSILLFMNYYPISYAIKKLLLFLFIISYLNQELYSVVYQSIFRLKLAILYISLINSLNFQLIVSFMTGDLWDIYSQTKHFYNFYEILKRKFSRFAFEIVFQFLL